MIATEMNPLENRGGYVRACIVGLLLLPTSAGVAQAAVDALALQTAAAKVGQFQKIEFQVHSPKSYTNPFDPDEVELSLVFTPTNGPAESVPAFWCQDYEHKRVGTPGKELDWLYPMAMPGWKVRFAPRRLGTYQAVAVRKDRDGTITSKPITFDCVPSTSRGFIRVSRTDPRYLQFDNGKPFFAIGQNLAFIGPHQYVTPGKVEEIFAKLGDDGANYLRIWTCCDDWAMAIESRKSAWGRSWDWHPPLAAIPGQEGSKGLRISSRNPILNVDPSYAVALRPRTRYTVSGKVWLAGPAAIRLEAQQLHLMRTLTLTADKNWAAFREEFETGPEDLWLGPMRFRLEGTGEAWLGEVSLKERDDGPELLWEAEINRPVRGFYNPLDSYLLDEVIAAAERHGLYLQLCLLTRDLYMNALKNADGPEYQRAIRDANKFLRYAVGRWGYSTSVAAWEYWNEMNPSLPTDRFYTALGAYLEQTDVYHHLRTTSTWGPSAKDCRHSKLDLVDVHFYLRPPDKARLSDEVDAVLERARWLRDQAPYKPAHLGEFGLANQKWQPTEEMKRSQNIVDAHNALWASALSGASGTALFWWWERLDERNVYPLYRPLSAFLAEVPWTSGEVQQAAATVNNPRIRVAGLRTHDQAWLWFFDRQASWEQIVVQKQEPTVVKDLQMQVNGLPNGTYRVLWWDTRAGRLVFEKKQKVRKGILRADVPSFLGDIACQIK
jgi:hypothetical protein